METYVEHWDLHVSNLSSILLKVSSRLFRPAPVTELRKTAIQAIADVQPQTLQLRIPLYTFEGDNAMGHKRQATEEHCNRSLSRYSPS